MLFRSDDVFQGYPQVVDQNWYNVDHLSSAADEVLHATNGNRTTPSKFEALCFSSGKGLFFAVLLPPTKEVGYEEYEFLEECIDTVATMPSSDDRNLDGCIYGKQLNGIQGKLRRNSDYGILANTYSEALERAIQSNKELLRAVGPYFRSSEDIDTLEKIKDLRETINYR